MLDVNAEPLGNGKLLSQQRPTNDGANADTDVAPHAGSAMETAARDAGSAPAPHR